MIRKRILEVEHPVYGTVWQLNPVLVDQLPKEHPPIKPSLRRRGWRRG